MAISIPYAFTANTDILSAQVNANFDALLNALDKRGDTLTGNLTVASGVTIDGVDISAVIGTGGTLLAVDGSAVTNLNASNLASGTVGTARLGSGTASSSFSWMPMPTATTYPLSCWLSFSATCRA